MSTYERSIYRFEAEDWDAFPPTTKRSPARPCPSSPTAQDNVGATIAMRPQGDERVAGLFLDVD